MHTPFLKVIYDVHDCCQCELLCMMSHAVGEYRVVEGAVRVDGEQDDSRMILELNSKEL